MIIVSMMFVDRYRGLVIDVVRFARWTIVDCTSILLVLFRAIDHAMIDDDDCCCCCCRCLVVDREMNDSTVVVVLFRPSSNCVESNSI